MRSEGQRLESVLVLALALFSCRVTPVAGPRLLEEYDRNLREVSGRCERFREILDLLRNRLEVVSPRDELVRLCREAHPKGDPADAEHAAVCLQTGAFLVSLDVHFRAVSRELDRRGMSLEVYDPAWFLRVLDEGSRR